MPAVYRNSEDLRERDSLEGLTSKAKLAPILTRAYHGEVGAFEEVARRCLHVWRAHALME
jgi:hypothetical protein